MKRLLTRTIAQFRVKFLECKCNCFEVNDLQNQLCEAGFYLYWHVAKKVFSLGIFIFSLFSWHFMNGLSRVVHNSPASTVAI